MRFYLSLLIVMLLMISGAGQQGTWTGTGTGTIKRVAGTMIPPPSVPTGLTATAATSSRIDLVWTAAVGAETYNVLQSATSGGPFTQLISGITATSYGNSGLAPSTTYYYVVQAVNAGGVSGNSNQASATTTAPPAAGVIEANSCSAYDVQAALDSIAKGPDPYGPKVVQIPAGVCTWNQSAPPTGVSYTPVGPLTIQGAGNPTVANPANIVCSSTTSCSNWSDDPDGYGSGPQTTIIDDISRRPPDLASVNDRSAMTITTVAGLPFRLTNLIWAGTDRYDPCGAQSSSYGCVDTANGSLRIVGSGDQVRIDHIWFRPVRGLTVLFGGRVTGVADNDVVFMWSNAISFRDTDWLSGTTTGTSGQGGDGSWAAPSNFGTGLFMFLEDSKFDGRFNWSRSSDKDHPGVAQGWTNGNDCSDGGRFVIRHNLNVNGAFQTHNNAARGRGCRNYEIYSNTFVRPVSPWITPSFFNRMGTGLWWDNHITGHAAMLSWLHDRTDMGFNQANPPNLAPPGTAVGWGNCGEPPANVGTYTWRGPSCWDGNQDSYGYPCLGQIGRGQGDFLNGVSFAAPFTGVCAWPHEKLEPIYAWANTFTPSTVAQTATYWGHGGGGITALIQQNRDFYVEQPIPTGFTGYTSAPNCAGTSSCENQVGQGTRALRPANCTPLAAYWASDEQNLYQCSATNTWTLYYHPYTYPHPLQAIMTLHATKVKDGYMVEDGRKRYLVKPQKVNKSNKK